MKNFRKCEPAVPAVVNRDIFQAGQAVLRVREKVHIRKGNAIAPAFR